METSTTRLQQVTAVAPLLCAIHCLALPIAIALLPELAFFGSPIAERLLFAGTAMLAMGMAVRGIRAHGRAAPLLAVAVLVAVWGVTLWSPVAADLEHVVGAACGAGIAVSLLWTIRLRHRHVSHGCACGACDAHMDDGEHG